MVTLNGYEKLQGVAAPHRNYFRQFAHYAQVLSLYVFIDFLYMESTVDRFILLIEMEGIKMPWLEDRTGVDAKRWHTIKQRKVMRTNELDAITELWPEYAYWLATGKELPEAGQISPMTKKVQRDLKTGQQVG